MNICGEYAALLDAFLDGELSPEEMDGVQRHLEACPACRDYVDDCLAIRAAFPNAEDQAVPAGFAAEVTKALRTLPQKSAPANERRRKTVWFRAAATLAAGFAIVLVLRYALPGGGFYHHASLQNASQNTAEDACTPQMAAMAPETDAAEPAPAEAAPYAYRASGDEETADPDKWKVRVADAPPAMEEQEPNAPESAACPQNKENMQELLQDGGIPAKIQAKIPADQADLLAGYPSQTDEDGIVWHCLSGAEYRDLAAALESRGITPELSAEDVRDGETVQVRTAEE